MPTDTAATEPRSAFESPNRSSARARRRTRPRSRRSACRRPPGARRSRARASARRAPRSRPPPAARARSAAGSRPCGRPACRGVASRSVRSPGRGRQQRVLGRHPAAAAAASASAARRSSTDAVQRTIVLALRGRAPSRAAARASPGSSASGRSWSGRRPSCLAGHQPPPRARSASPARPRRAAAAGTARRGRGTRTGRPSSGSGTTPRASSSFSIPLRASVSATSRAVSSAEKTSVTPRPKTRWRIGRISG